VKRNSLGTQAHNKKGVGEPFSLSTFLLLQNRQGKRNKDQYQPSTKQEQ